MMHDSRARDTGRLAIATGAVAVGSAVSLAIYFAAQGPFGTINDLGNAATGIFSGWLAWRLRLRASSIAVAAALVGAAATVVGSALVVSGATGFLFAGLVSGVGFAAIGAWLLAVNRGYGEGTAWPRGLPATGIAAGALMALGIVLAPGIPLGLNDMATAPAWVWVGFMSWIGTYITYPAWAIWMGLVEMRRAGQAHQALTASSAAE